MPPTNTATGVSWQAAYAKCQTAEAACVPDRTATVALADATTARSGTQRAVGSLQPFAQDRLAYVITFTGVPCMPIGPPGRPPPAAPYICTFVSLIDAQTGVVIFSLSGPDLQDR